MTGPVENPAPAETPGDVHRALERGEICLIDVREPGEFAQQRISGALLFPLSTFNARFLPTGGRPIVFCCGTGKRSAAAFEMARRDGVAVRSHLDGGLLAWRGAGLPVFETDPTTGAIRCV